MFVEKNVFSLYIIALTCLIPCDDKNSPLLYLWKLRF